MKLKIEIELFPDAFPTLIEALDDYVDANKARVASNEEQDDHESAEYYADQARAGEDLKRIVLQAHAAHAKRAHIKLLIDRALQDCDEECQDAGLKMSRLDRIDYAFGRIDWKAFPEAKLDTHAKRVAFVKGCVR